MLGTIGPLRALPRANEEDIMSVNRLPVSILVACISVGCATEPVTGPDNPSDDPTLQQSVAVTPDHELEATTTASTLSLCPVAHTCPNPLYCEPWGAPKVCASSCRANDVGCSYGDGKPIKVKFPHLDTTSWTARTCHYVASQCIEYAVTTVASCNDDACCTECE
jgi:hypothetical protein